MKRSTLALCAALALSLPAFAQNTAPAVAPANSGVAAEPYGIALEGYPYPHPVHLLPIIWEGRALRMAYMDVAAPNPNGKAVLLLHGRNFPGSYWAGALDALTRAGYRVVVPDQIHFGKSSKPDDLPANFDVMAGHTLALLDHLKLAQVDVLAQYAGLATIGLVAARMIAPGRHELELDIYVLVLGGFGLLVMSSALGQIAPREDESLLEEALQPEPPEVARIAGLERLEREVALAASREYDLHYRLRPVLREIAAARLERRGARLDSDSPRARELLGDELWSLTEPDREPPSNRQAAGIGFEELERTVERLERL